MKCPSCGVSLKRRGISSHIRGKKNQACRDYFNNETVFDLQGDFFGNYDAYLTEDTVNEEMELDVDNNGPPEDSSDTEDKGDPETETEASESEEDYDLDVGDNRDLEPPRVPPNGNLEPLPHIPPLEPSEPEPRRHVPETPTIYEASCQLHNPPVVCRFPGRAGQIYSTENLNGEDGYKMKIGSENMYAPFASKLEWEVAKWAKLQGPTSTAFTDLMKIEGVTDLLNLSFRSSSELNKMIDVLPLSLPRFTRHQVLVGSEMCDVYCRNIIQCIRALLDDSRLSPHMFFVPEKHYTDETKTRRLYHDMNTGKWWWATQKAIEKDSPGGTIIPIIIATDKTQLTLFRNKSAYPVYLTIGNIPKEIRRKPSSRGYLLLGYLPTTRLEGVTNKASRRRMIANLYHSCMKEVLKPLEKAGEEGVMMATADGKVRRMHPILAAFVGDYPEQVLATCVYSGDCPCCTIAHVNLGDGNSDDELRDIEQTFDILSTFEDDASHFFQICRDSRIKPVGAPFWRDLPYLNIYLSITPDILHQLYQGLVKHLVNWLIQAFGALEIDARCRRLPANHNIQTFMKGISFLSHISGKEHDQISRILIALVVDLDLGNGQSAVRLVRSVRAILDFLFLAQYPVHTDSTIELLDGALEKFHENKDIFIDLGIRNNFNFPKLHFAKHYALKIKFFGTTDNFNTEYTERLHIDLAKDAYRATNRKEEFTQMTTWLERQEKVHRHDQFIHSQLSNAPPAQSSPQKEWVTPGLSISMVLHLSHRPSSRKVTINDLVDKYGAFYFHEALSRFVVLARSPSLTSAELERAIWGVQMPVRRLWVWHRIKFRSTDPFKLHTTTVDTIHANPSSQRFDTVLVRIDKSIPGIHGCRVARLRTVFSMPPTIRRSVFSSDSNTPDHLAYVEWYTNIPQNADPDHGLYKVSLEQDRDRSGHGIGSIIPVSDIVCSIHLYPHFGPFVPVEWTNKNILDRCSAFYINPFTSRQLYRFIG